MDFFCFREGGSLFGADAALREEDVGTEAEEETLGFESILVMLFVTDWTVDYSRNITPCRTVPTFALAAALELSDSAADSAAL